MDYQTFQPHSDLESLVKCHWTLEVPADKSAQRQRIVPDGCIEMIFILGEDVRRYTRGKEFIIQPRAMVLGQITEPFFVEPTGNVSSFATRFYPYGFANFIGTPIKKLANKETPINTILKDDLSKRRQLERKFLRQIGISPKQLGKVIRMQTALKMLLSQQSKSFTKIAYESEYYDQAHFIKDFKEFTGTTPKEFLDDRQMALSSLLYKKD